MLLPSDIMAFSTCRIQFSDGGGWEGEGGRRKEEGEKRKEKRDNEKLRESRRVNNAGS